VFPNVEVWIWVWWWRWIGGGGRKVGLVWSWVRRIRSQGGCIGGTCALRWQQVAEAKAEEEWRSELGCSLPRFLTPKCARCRGQGCFAKLFVVVLDQRIGNSTSSSPDKNALGSGLMNSFAFPNRSFYSIFTFYFRLVTENFSPFSFPFQNSPLVSSYCRSPQTNLIFHFHFTICL